MPRCSSWSTRPSVGSDPDWQRRSPTWSRSRRSSSGTSGENDELSQAFKILPTDRVESARDPGGARLPQGHPPAIPFLFLIYVVAYLDRVNVSFAQLQLEDDLAFSDTIFGIGAGIFSLGYVLFGVPSNLALERFGARRWLAAIMVVWGVLSPSTMLIESAAAFYVLRFLLGRGGGRLLPGDHPVPDLVVPRARAHAGPRSVPHRDLGGLRGRRAALGGPARAGRLPRAGRLAVAVPGRGAPRDRARLGHPALPRRPARQARTGSSPRSVSSWRPRWRASTSCKRGRGRQGPARRPAERPALAPVARLLPGDRGRLRAHLLRPRPRPGPHRLHATSRWASWRRIPYGVATAVMLLVAARAERAPSGRPYVILRVLVGALGCVLTAYVQSPVLLTVAITLSAVGLLSVLPVFWAYPTALFGGYAPRRRGSLWWRPSATWADSRPRLHRDRRGLDGRLRDAADRARRPARRVRGARPWASASAPAGARPRRPELPAVLPGDHEQHERHHRGHDHHDDVHDDRGG